MENYQALVDYIGRVLVSAEGTKGRGLQQKLNVSSFTNSGLGGHSGGRGLGRGGCSGGQSRGRTGGHAPDGTPDDRFSHNGYF